MAAIAGRVMPLMKGAYDSSTTYEPLDFVTYNNALWGCIKTSKGNTPSEGTYWKKAIDGNVSDAASLGGETAEQWQAKLDSIQTTSRATLSQAGWYRVAEYATTDENIAKGFASNSCELTIKQRADNTTGESIKLRLDSVLRKQSITAVSVKRHSTSYNAFTKCRYTYDSTGAYLEVYYSLSAMNVCLFVVDNPLDLVNTWKAITPTLTAETVDGVTVTTTYDIPANATPVNSVDLVGLTAPRVMPVGTDLNDCIANGLYYFDGTATSYANTPNANAHNGLMIVSRFTSATSLSTRISQIYISCNHEEMYLRTTLGTAEWKPWQRMTTASDLANYLDKRTGGIVKGTISFVLADNGKGSLFKNNSATADYGTVLRDTDASGNKADIVVEAKKGKAYFQVNGGDVNEFIHAGNAGDYALLKDGGGTVQAANSNPLKVKNTSGNDCYIPFVGKGGPLGYLGFSDINSLMFVTADAAAATVILHTGNSARVVPATSAPSDTTVLWIDTANKKVKSYIDGAWTALA